MAKVTFKGYISSIIRQKGESQNECFKKTKHVKFSEKRTFTFLTCAYQGVRNIRFSQNLTCFIFLKQPFWDSPFRLITDDLLENSAEVINMMSVELLVVPIVRTSFRRFTVSLTLQRFLLFAETLKNSVYWTWSIKIHGLRRVFSWNVIMMYCQLMDHRTCTLFGLNM